LDLRNQHIDKLTLGLEVGLADALDDRQGFRQQKKGDPDPTFSGPAWGAPKRILYHEHNLALKD
jgi:hypothetical protein